MAISKIIVTEIVCESQSFHQIYFMLAKLLLYLKLFVEPSHSIKTFVSFLELIQSSLNVRGWYLSVATYQCLQNSIVNEGVLIL